MRRFRTGKSMLIVSILSRIDDALHVDGAEHVHKGLHILILHSQGIFTGLRSPIFRLPGSLLGVLSHLGRLDVSNLYA
jgi:hypothetical protein